MKKGKFIVIEGGEGSGKSSAIAWLKKELPEGDFIFTREPGGTPNAEEIRGTIIARRKDELDTLTLLLLFEAARREHVLKTVAPALAAGRHVISDRFSASTYAYQIVAGKGSSYTALFFELDALARGGLEPDHTIFLDVEPELGIARKNGSGDSLNLFDEKNLAFHREVRKGMKEYLADKPHTLVDASVPQESVHESVKRSILTLTDHG